MYMNVENLGTPLRRYLQKNSLRHENLIGKKVVTEDGDIWFINSIDPIHDITKLPYQVYCGKRPYSEFGTYINTNQLFVPDDIDLGVGVQVQPPLSQVQIQTQIQEKIMITKFKEFINEDFVYISQNQIPNGIREWIKEESGSYLKDFKIDQSGERVRVKMPWHEACTEVYQFFDLTHEDAIPVGNSVSRSGSEGNSPQGYLEGQTKDGYVEVPQGKVLVVYCTYPRSAKIFTSKGAQLFLPDTSKSNDLTDEELIILQAAKSYKPFARPKFSDEFYENLFKKGLLAKNRSITNDGRNLISNSDVKQKITKAIDNYNKKTGRYLGLSVM